MATLQAPTQPHTQSDPLNQRVSSPFPTDHIPHELYAPPEYSSLLHPGPSDPAPLPEYNEQPSSSHLLDFKPSPALDDQTDPSEKMRLDLDSITRAIDRLSTVAPQFHDQRVDARPSKADGTVPEIEQPYSFPSKRPAGQDEGKGKEVEGRQEQEQDQELAGIWESIERAHGRRLNTQASPPFDEAILKDKIDKKVRLYSSILYSITLG